MHQHIINASIQILPVVQDRHPYLWVDEAIAIIQQAGIKHEVGPFTTVLEGTYEEVMDVINSINEHLRQQGCSEWIMGLQIQIVQMLILRERKKQRSLTDKIKEK